jgi:hypothetical protein
LLVNEAFGLSDKRQGMEADSLLETRSKERLVSLRQESLLEQVPRYTVCICTVYLGGAQLPVIISLNCRSISWSLTAVTCTVGSRQVVDVLRGG